MRKNTTKAAIVAAVLSMELVPPASPASTLPTVPSLGGCRVVDTVSAKGRVTGQVTYFGTQSAKEARIAGKASGMKGEKLTEYVNATLRGDSEARNLLASAKLQCAFNAGGIADTARDTKGRLVISVVKPQAVVPKVDPKDALVAKLVASGKFTAEEAALMLA